MSSPSAPARIATLAIASLVVGCGRAEMTTADAESDGPLRVVATTGMVADLVAAVGGDRVSVETLVPPGADPHLYKPVTDDVRRLRSADVVAVSGLGLEGQMGDILLNLEEKGRPVIDVTAGLDRESLISVTEAGRDAAVDPHVWNSPAMWKACLGHVKERLTEIVPDAAEEFEANAAAYAAELDALSTYCDEAIATVPESARKLVTAHDAFSYFCRDYGFEVLSVQGVTTESEAGLGDIKEVVSRIVETDIRAVFVESTIPERAVEALIEGAAAKDHEVTLGGTLYSDSVGQAGTYEASYLGMIDHNVTTIAAALGGEVPAGGRLGKLSEPASGPNVTADAALAAN